MGKIFLMMLSLPMLVGPVQSYAADIFLDPIPRPIAPPQKSEEDTEVELRQKREVNAARKQELAPKPVDPTTRRDDTLIAEGQKDRPYRFMTQISLLYPVIKTSGPRTHYTVDVSNHFHLFYRVTDDLKEKNLFLGFRVAPFVGSGIYEKTVGRYGFTFFGPIIGLGKIGPAESDPKEGNVKEATTSEELQARRIFPSRHGWLLYGGVALLSRIGRSDPSNDPVDKDLDTGRGAVVDGSGLWMEFAYMTIHFGAVGVNYLGGVQLAGGKTFAWLGVAAAGWY